MSDAWVAFAIAGLILLGILLEGLGVLAMDYLVGRLDKFVKPSRTRKAVIVILLLLVVVAAVLYGVHDVHNPQAYKGDI